MPLLSEALWTSKQFEGTNFPFRLRYIIVTCILDPHQSPHRWKAYEHLFWLFRSWSDRIDFQPSNAHTLVAIVVSVFIVICAVIYAFTPPCLLSKLYQMNHSRQAAPALPSLNQAVSWVLATYSWSTINDQNVHADPSDDGEVYSTDEEEEISEQDLI